MNKSQLISAIANSSGMSLAQAEKALASTLEGIAEALTNGNDVSLVGFGRFGVKKRAARKVRNPKTGEEMMLAETIVPFFKAGKNLKDMVDVKEEI